MSVQIVKKEFGGWPNCYEISNGDIELIITSDIGPRILWFSLKGNQNMFKVYEDSLGKSGEPDWQLRGGHRIWVAPEHVYRTYQPDNGAVQISMEDGVLTATQPVEAATGIEKQIIVKMADKGGRVEVIHRLRNTLAWPIEFAAWALTMMTTNGYAITGYPPRGTHPEMLAPTNPLIMWAFTDLSDERYKFLKKYFVLRQDEKNSTPTKLGHFNEDTWGAYQLGKCLFVKRTKAFAGKPYPDMGCSFETFTRHEMLELETLGPITKVEPGEALEHTEHWALYGDVEIPEWSDEAVDAVLGPILAERF